MMIQKVKENEEEEESKDIYDDEEMNIQMSNKLSELKQVLKDNNTSLEEECKDKIKIIEENNSQSIISFLSNYKQIFIDNLNWEGGNFSDFINQKTV